MRGCVRQEGGSDGANRDQHIGRKTMKGLQGQGGGGGSGGGE